MTIRVFDGFNTKLKRRRCFCFRATDAPATASEYVDPPPLWG